MVRPPSVAASDGSAGRQPAGRDAPGAPAAPRGWLLAAVGLLGVSAVVTQLVLMRELLCVLAGNELVLGVILGNWFLLTGAGAALGRSARRLRRPLNVLVAAQVLAGVLPAATVFALRSLRNVVFIRGAEIGPAGSIVTCFVVLLPYCLLAGYVLTLACELLAEERGGGIGQVYFLDALGDIVGGLLFTFLLVWVLSDFVSLYVPAAGNLAMAVAMPLRMGRKALAGAAGAVAALAVAVAAAFNLDARSTAAEYAALHVVYDSAGPYGRLVVTRTAGQHTFFLSGAPLFASHDIERVEETVHYAMAQRPAARRVLIVSGGASGTAREVLKYPAVETVVAVEIDPQVVEAARRLLGDRLADPRIRLERTDGRLFLRRSEETFDVIISDAPDPSTSQINRLFTAEFAAEAKRRLAPGGVLAVHVGDYANYVSPELRRLLACTGATLRTAFRNVLALPGGRVCFLASDGPLTADLAAAVARAGVRTQYVTGGFLIGNVTPEHLAELRLAAEASAPVNRGFEPLLYYLHLRHWLSQYRFRLAALGGVLLAALGVWLLRQRAVPLAVFAVGFAASGLEVVILLGFQIAHGSLYHRVGLIVTAFMAGLAGGSLLANRRPPASPRRALALAGVAVAALAVLLPPALRALAAVAAPLATALSAFAAFPLLTFLLAGLVGFVFPLAARADFQSVAVTASRLYTADYVGGCAGALLVSTLLVPLLGVPAACAIIAGVNVLAAAALGLRRRR